MLDKMIEKHYVSPQSVMLCHTHNAHPALSYVCHTNIRNVSNV